MATKTPESDTDARQGEYTTYAPKGETCPACKQGIKTLEPCRRIAQDRSSAGPAVRYQHAVCPT